jgi:hypothetical protein
MNRSVLACTFTALLTSACGLSTGGDPAAALAACAGDADVADATVLPGDFKESIHEMIQCGQLSFLLISSVINTAVVIAGEPSALPDAFAYQSGDYLTTGTGVVMTMSFFASDATPGFAAGDKIEANLFDPESFLVGATSTRDGETVTVTFSDTGPLVSLLGRGDAPTSPLVLTLDDLATTSAAPLGSLEATALIAVDDVREKTTVSYEVDVPEDNVASLLLTQSAPQNVRSASGVRDDLGQTLATTTWQLAYVNATHALSGTVTSSITGGPFDFTASFVYDGVSAEPVITYACAAE